MSLVMVLVIDNYDSFTYNLVQYLGELGADVRAMGHTTPILGVCLGHQAIGAVFGGEVVRAGVPMHGKTSTIEHDGQGVFSGIAGPFQASRYHSLVVAERSLPSELEVTARTREDSNIMGLRHRRWPVYG